MSSTSTVCAAAPLISAATRVVARRPSASVAFPMFSSSSNASSRSVAGGTTAPGRSAACQSITARLAWCRTSFERALLRYSCANRAKRSATNT
jgi:hypothetical protein